MLGLRIKLSLILGQLSVKRGKGLVSLGVEAVDLFGPFGEFLFDLFYGLDRLDHLSFERRYLLLQSVGLAHRGLVFLLILCVLQVAVGTLQIRLVLGDLLFKTGPIGMQLITLCLYLTNRKSVLFKLLFDLSTLCNCGFDYLFQPAKISICLLQFDQLIKICFHL